MVDVPSIGVAGRGGARVDVVGIHRSRCQAQRTGTGDAHRGRRNGRAGVGERTASDRHHRRRDRLIDCNRAAGTRQRVVAHCRAAQRQRAEGGNGLCAGIGARQRATARGHRHSVATHLVGHTQNPIRRIRRPLVGAAARQRHRQLVDRVDDRCGGDVVVVRRARETPGVAAISRGRRVRRDQRDRADRPPRLAVHPGDRRHRRRVRIAVIRHRVGRDHDRRIRLIDREVAGAAMIAMARVT